MRSITAPDAYSLSGSRLLFTSTCQFQNHVVIVFSLKIHLHLGLHTVSTLGLTMVADKRKGITLADVAQAAQLLNVPWTEIHFDTFR
jgi:hypothetical protein